MYDSAAPATMADEDLRFLQGQAREYLRSRAWEAIAQDTIGLRLKAGSWYEACSQAMTNGTLNFVFLFPGNRDLQALREASMGEPPAGTVFAELHKPEPGFRVITPRGWTQPDRLESRLMSLTFAAMVAVAAAPEGEVLGDLPLPGGVRGRYAARRIPADPERGQFLVGVPRFDLYDDDVSVTMMNLAWTDYEAVRRRAQHYQGVGEEFSDRGDLVPVLVVSGPAEVAKTITGKLRDSDPRGITFGEMDGVLAVLAGGLRDSYVLLQATDERESVLGWWYGAKSAGGAHAIVVSDSTPDRAGDPWAPTSVQGVFEFGRQKAHAP